MSNRFGKSHVDGDSVWVYKIKLEWDGNDCADPYTENYRSNLRTTPYVNSITLRITQDNAREIVKALRDGKSAMCLDQRGRCFEVERTEIRHETDGDALCRSWTYQKDLTDDYGTNSWQGMLAQLTRWIGP